MNRGVELYSATILGAVWGISSKILSKFQGSLVAFRL